MRDAYGREINPRPTAVLVVVAMALAIGVLGGILMAENDSVNQKLNSVFPALANLTRHPPAKAESPDALCPAPTGFPTMENICYSFQPGLTLLEIQLGSSTLVRTSRLHTPERVYFDLRNSRSSKGSASEHPKAEKKSVSAGLLSAIRVSPRGATEMRIVLDMKSRCEFSYKELPQPSPHLVIELRTSPD